MHWHKRHLTFWKIIGNLEGGIFFAGGDLNVPRRATGVVHAAKEAGSSTTTLTRYTAYNFWHLLSFVRLATAG